MHEPRCASLASRLLLLPPLSVSEVSPGLPLACEQNHLLRLLWTLKNIFWDQIHPFPPPSHDASSHRASPAHLRLSLGSTSRRALAGARYFPDVDLSIFFQPCPPATLPEDDGKCRPPARTEREREINGGAGESPLPRVASTAAALRQGWRGLTRRRDDAQDRHDVSRVHLSLSPSLVHATRLLTHTHTHSARDTHIKFWFEL